jgi:hypothetical protein
MYWDYKPHVRKTGLQIPISALALPCGKILKHIFFCKAEMFFTRN